MQILLIVSVAFVAIAATTVRLIVQKAKESPVLRGNFPFNVVHDNFNLQKIPNLQGKVIIVTGANSGVGKSTAKFLAQNGATVVMGCRSPLKCDIAKADIVKEIKNSGESLKGELIPMAMDLSALESIKSFSDQFNNQYQRLDSLILNAGVVGCPFTLTKDGFELQFGTNHVGHFYLTNLLMPKLKQTEPSTVVVVSSNSAFMSYPEGIRLDLESLNDPKTYDPMAAYGQSKLANILFAIELSARLQSEGAKVFVNSLNPGITNSDAFQHFGPTVVKIKDIIFRALDGIVFSNPDRGCLTSLYCSVSPEIINKEVTGKYFVPIGDEAPVPDLAKDKKFQQDLWNFTEDIIANAGFKLNMQYSN